MLGDWIKRNEPWIKRILICIDWYEPGFKAGGPISSVANIVSALKDDFEFYILTSAYDLGETEPYPDVTVNEWFDQDGLFQNTWIKNY